MDRGNGQRRECKYRNLTTQRRGNLLPAIAPPHRLPLHQLPLHQLHPMSIYVPGTVRKALL